MARKRNYLYSTTYIVLDPSNETELKCIKLLEFFGKAKKAILLTTLIYIYPEYFSSGAMSKELESLIEKYRKSFEADESKTGFFFGWHYFDNANDRAAHELLNVKLGGGAKDFIVHIFSTYLPLFFGGDIVVSNNTKTPVTKAVRKISDDDNYEIDAKTLNQFDDDDELLDQFDDDYEIIPAEYISAK